MKFFLTVLIISMLACFIDGLKEIGEKCNNHAECGDDGYEGCFEGICQWSQNYLSPGEHGENYVAEKLGDPCMSNSHCRSLPNSRCGGDKRCVSSDKE